MLVDLQGVVYNHVGMMSTRNVLKRAMDGLVALAIWAFAIHDLSKWVGDVSWSRSIAIVGSIGLAIMINRGLVFLYTKYGPDRLRDSTTHLMVGTENRNLDQ